MASVVSRIYQKLKRSIGAYGFIIRTASNSVLANDPSISSGTGVPSATEPNGSTWHRTDGTVGASLYSRVGGAWKALADAAQVAAILAENTDVVIPMSYADYLAVSGTWTLTRQGTALYRIRRTAGAAVESVAFRFTPRQRTSASKGFKVTGAKVVYKLSTSDVADVTVSGAFLNVPADGSAPAAATSLGTVTYDAGHDTTAKRKSSSTNSGNHTMTVTFGTPVYLNSESAVVELLLTCDATGLATAQLDIVSVELLGAETLVDAA